MSSKSIILDANIVIRAVLGERVRNLIIQHQNKVDFFVPDVCIMDAQKYIPQIFEKRKISAGPALELLKELDHIFNIVEVDVYEQYSNGTGVKVRVFWCHLPPFYC